MKKNWSMFCISIGFLIITILPYSNNKIISFIIALVLIILGIIMMKRDKK